MKIENSFFHHRCLTPPLRGNPSEFLDETYAVNTRVMEISYDENCIILTLSVLDCSNCMTDGRAIAYSALSTYNYIVAR